MPGPVLSPLGILTEGSPDPRHRPPARLTEPSSTLIRCCLPTLIWWPSVKCTGHLGKPTDSQARASSGTMVKLLHGNLFYDLVPHPLPTNRHPPCQDTQNQGTATHTVVRVGTWHLSLCRCPSFWLRGRPLPTPGLWSHSAPAPGVHCVKAPPTPVAVSVPASQRQPGDVCLNDLLRMRPERRKADAQTDG